MSETKFISPDFPTPAIAQKAEAALADYHRVRLALVPARPVHNWRPDFLNDLEPFALMESCRRGDSAVVAGEIGKGEPQITAERMSIALAMAAWHGHAGTVTLLLKHGADSAARNCEALMAAIMNGHRDVADLLIGQGLDVEKYGYGLLWTAVETGDKEIVTRLLGLGAKIEGHGGGSALVVAAKKGHTEIAALLLDHGADIGADDHGAIRGAVAAGHIETVAMILDRAPGIMDRQANILLDIALKTGTPAMLDHILSCLRKPLSWNPDAYGAIQNDQVEVADVLFRHGINIAVTCRQSLLWTTTSNAIGMAGWLLKHGVDTGVDGEALSKAAANGHTEIVAMLLDHGADIAARNHQALQWAAGHRRVATVDLLLARGADVSAENYDAFRRVACSNYRHSIEVTGLILECRKDIPAKILNDVFRGALRNGDEQTAALLVKHGAELVLDHQTIAEFFRWHPGQIINSAELESRLRTGAPERESWKPEKSYDAQVALWRRALRRDPLPHLWQEDPALFKGTCYEAVCRILRAENYRWETAATMAFHTAALFQTPERVLQYLKQWGGAGSQPLHDLVQMIKVPSALPDGTKPNLKDWADGVLKCGPSMAKLVKFADRLPSPVKTDDGRTWSMVKTREECAKFSYRRGAENSVLAALCFEHNVDEKDFEKALAIVQAKQPANKNIPDFAVAGETFGMPGGTFRRLADGDINGLFLGEMTDCCQSIGSAGAVCATHGFTSENGGFYVVENAKGRIVGQSWAWRGSEGELCLDSLETLGKNVNGDQWMNIVTAFRDAVAANNNHNITALTVGTNGATGNSCPALKSTFNKRVAAKPCDYNGYRDSNTQILVWRVPHV